MALFRIFRRKQSINNSTDKINKGGTKGGNLNLSSWSLGKDDLSESTSFELPDIRFVVFRENEWKERRLLFDSDAFQTTQIPKTSPVKTAAPTQWDLSPQSPNCNGNASPVLEEEPVTTTTRLKSDSKLLGEMIFGSVTMSYKGDTIKLHQFKNPPKLMLTRVFNLPQVRRKSCQPVICENGTVDTNGTITNSSAMNNESDSDSQYSTVNSLENYLNGGQKMVRSIPLDVPNSFVRQATTPSPEGSDLTRSSSRDFNAGTPSTPIASSLKRYHLNQFMNLQAGVQRRSSQPMDEDDGNAGNFCLRKRIQLGMAVIFSFGDDEEKLSQGAVCFREFLFSHMQIIESELLYLQREIIRAYHSKRQFSTCASQAWYHFRSSLKLLFKSSRLRTPVWLCLMNDQTDHKVEENFLTALFALSDACDRKETKFFISSLLTAFLTNHSSWISSVAPSTSASSLPSKPLNGCRLPQWGKNSEAGCHPSNPFWAQLLDVWGVLHSGRHSLRTLILGKDSELLLQILFVLSYFLRCSSLTIGRRFDEPACLPKLQCLAKPDDDVICSCSKLIEESTEFCTCEDDSINRASKPIKFSLIDESDENVASNEYQRFFSGALIESILDLNETKDKHASLSNVAHRSSKFSCLGSSLQVSLVEQFYPHFALSAMMTSNDVDAQVKEALKKAAYSESSASSIDCLIADTRDWTVRLLSCESSSLTCSESVYLPARTVLDLIDNVKALKSSNCDADFILMFVEDWLADIYSKGAALASMLDENDSVGSLDYLAALLGSDVSDMSLFLSVCSC